VIEGISLLIEVDEDRVDDVNETDGLGFNLLICGDVFNDEPKLWEVLVLEIELRGEL